MAVDKDKRGAGELDAEDATEIVPASGEHGGAGGAHSAATVPGRQGATEYPFDSGETATAVTEPAAATEVQPPIGMQPSQVIPPAAAGRGTPPLVRWLSVAAVVIAVALAALLLVDRLDLASDGTVPRGDPAAPALAVAEAALAAGDVEDLPARLLATVRDHPDNPALEALLADANRYLELRHLRESGQLLALAQQRAEAPFESPVFEAAAAREVDPAVPAADVVERMAAAEAAWEQGELVEAIEGVRQLSKAPGGEWAAQRLQHYTRVVEAYDQLSAAAGNAEYPRLLLAFYLGLDPLRDRFFWARLARDFEPAGGEVAAAAGQLESAARAWGNYWYSGGITGAMRQDARSRNLFGRLAAELQDTRQYLAAVTARLVQLGGGTTGAHLFPSLVDAEIARQRTRLRTLLEFHDDPVLVERLQQLPPAAGVLTESR